MQVRFPSNQADLDHIYSSIVYAEVNYAIASILSSECSRSMNMNTFLHILHHQQTHFYTFLQPMSYLTRLMRRQIQKPRPPKKTKNEFEWIRERDTRY